MDNLHTPEITDHIQEVTTLLDEFIRFKFVNDGGLVYGESSSKLAVFWLVTRRVS